jgi:EpsI family protein
MPADIARARGLGWVSVLRWGAGLAFALALALVFAPAAAALVAQWWRHEEYSYGFLIPLISLYLVRTQRPRLAPLAFAPSLVGGGLALAAALFLLLLGRAAGVILVEEVALVAAVAATVLLLCGRAVVRALALPLAYLLFMIPFWDLVAAQLNEPLQGISARLATALLRAFGVPVYRDGFLLHLSSTPVLVADVCSGARFLISVLAIGVPLAYLFLRHWTRRVALILLGLAVSILSNGVRVAVVAVLFNNGVMKPADGVFHSLQGVLISWVGYAALFAGAWLLGRTEPAPSADAVPTAATPVAGSRDVATSALAVALCLTLAAAVPLAYEPRPVPLAASLDRLPLVLGPWTGHDVPAEAVDGLAVDQGLGRRYRTATGDDVTLYVGYLAAQRQDRELVGEATARLHERAQAGAIDAGADRGLRVNRSSWLGPGKQPRLGYFWYDLNGRVLTGRYQVKARGVLEALVHRRSNCALVVVSVDPPAAGETSDGLAGARDLIGRLRPELARLLPRG